MSLNVKDPEAHRLAQAIASITGETITRTVISSLQQRMERLHDKRHDPERMATDLNAIAKRASAHIKGPYQDHGDFLYDEHGLPK